MTFFHQSFVLFCAVLVFLSIAQVCAADNTTETSATQTSVPPTTVTSSSTAGPVSTTETSTSSATTLSTTTATTASTSTTTTPTTIGTTTPTTIGTTTPTTTSTTTTTTAYPSFKAIAFGKKGVSESLLRSNLEESFTKVLRCELHADCDIAYLTEEPNGSLSAHTYFRDSKVRERFVEDVNSGGLVNVANAVIVTDAPAPTHPAPRSETGVVVGVVLGLSGLLVIVVTLLVYRRTGYRGVLVRGERERLV